MNEYYTVSEFSKITGKDPGNIRRMLIAGRLEGEKVGKQWLIKKTAKYPDDERVSSGKYHNSRKLSLLRAKNNHLLKVLKRLVTYLCLICGENIDEVVLYGSYARGTNDDESDVDIAVVLKKEFSKKIHDLMIDKIVDLELECDKVLSVVTVKYDDYNNDNNISPFYKNIKKEGIVLWKAV